MKIKKDFFASFFGILLSRISGFFRDLLFAFYFGTKSSELASFLTAFTLPNLFRRTFGEGALNNAFVPLLAQKNKLSFKQEQHFSNVILSSLLVFLSSVVFAFIAIILIISLLSSSEIQFILYCCAIMLPYAIFICLFALLSSILNLRNLFFLPTFTSAILNICLIISCYLSKDFSRKEAIYALAISVVIGGILQLAILYYKCKKIGYKFKFMPSFKTRSFRQLKNNFLSCLANSGLIQLSTLSDRLIAWLIGKHAVNALYYSERLIQLPIGLFGTAISIISLPKLAKLNPQDDNYNALLIRCLNLVFLLTIPCTVFFYFFHVEIITILFQRGDFNAESVQQTSLAIKYYLPAISAFALLKVLTNVFYAKKDTKTPLKISSISFILNIVLGLSLLQFLEQGALSLASSFGAIFSCIFLLKKLTLNNKKDFIKNLFFNFSYLLLLSIAIFFCINQQFPNPSFFELLLIGSLSFALIILILFFTRKTSLNI